MLKRRKEYVRVFWFLHEEFKAADMLHWIAEFEFNGDQVAVETNETAWNELVQDWPDGELSDAELFAEAKRFLALFNDPPFEKLEEHLAATGHLDAASHPSWLVSARLAAEHGEKQLTVARSPLDVVPRDPE